MVKEYRVADCGTYTTDAHWNAREGVVADGLEVKAVEEALECLVGAEVLGHAEYDREKMSAFRAAVKGKFDSPWTGISPRMQRLLYAVNAIAQPKVMVGVGIFCGFTFVCNAGAAIGPGACYEAERLIGIEIDATEAERARKNLATIDEDGQVEIITADGISWLRDFAGEIDLLYLDAAEIGGRGKSIYLDVLDASRHCLGENSLVLAHNSVNSAKELAEYLDTVRDPRQFRESVNVIIDDQGLEVSAGYRGG
jgi:predicted O-methyltransferase YrrM